MRPPLIVFGAIRATGWRR